MFASQPSFSSPLQLSQSASQPARPHVPFAHDDDACASSGQVLPQLPQFAAVSSFASQPFDISLSQSL